MTDTGDDLIELGYVPKARDYLRDVWSRREFALEMPFTDLRAQKLNTALGQLWHILNPAMNVFVYYIIFGLVLEVDRGVDNYIGFLAIGVLLFTGSTRVLNMAVGAMEREQGLIRTVQFPRAILPIASTIEETLAFFPAIPVLLVTLVLDGSDVTLRWLIFPVTLVMMTFLNLGLALVIARAGFGIRDLAQVVQHVTRLLFYASGVLFLPTRFVESELGLRLFALNPIYDVITFARWSLIGTPMTTLELAGAIAYPIVLPIIGFVWFIRAEHRYGGSA
ncbi:MAG: hypothetical protein AAF548_00675 [Actinomycetota bacterium]